MNLIYIGIQIMNICNFYVKMSNCNKIKWRKENKRGRCTIGAYCISPKLFIT